MSVVLLGSTSGSVTLQEPAIAGSTVIDLPATSGTMAVLPTATSVLPQASGGTGTTTGYYGFKNRIINGAMVIDQRNAGASYSAVDNGYSLDRWKSGSWDGSAQTGKYTVQQNAAAVTPPSGFTYYLGVTSSAATSITTSAQYFVAQNIEGFNLADFGFGAAGASTVTLSFWVRSSLTGTFGGALKNGAGNRAYPFTFTISAANTWEQKTITIAGDTTGTWLTTNGIGMQVVFGLGVGSTFSGTASAWAASNFYSATGATSVVGTSGATFYITGVQLEKGSTATSFDYRPYGTELALCQRYYETSYEAGNAVASTSNPSRSIAWFAQSTQNYNNQRVNFSVYKRSNPTIVLLNPATGTVSEVRNLDASTNLAGAVSGTSVTGFLGYANNVSVGSGTFIGYHYTASSEL